jgi:CBS domain-containing protein
MLAKEIMSKRPEFLPPTATLKQAADQMRTHDYGFLPVGENDRLIGAVTDRDITVKAVAEGWDPNKTTLTKVMTKGIHYCYETDTVENIATQMEQLQIRRLVVLDKNKRMTGIISLGDIATKCRNAKLCSELTDALSHHE